MNIVKAKQRIGNINRAEARRQPLYSDFILIKEYLRRVAHMESDAGIEMPRPIFNPSNLFPLRSNELETICNDSEAILSGLGSYTASLCKCYLMWCHLVDTKEITAYNHADLFEPLILLFERGGLINITKGEIFTGNKNLIPVHNWRIYKDDSPYDISTDNLNRLDKEREL